MEERAVRGVPWTLLGYGFSKAVTLGTTIVLARLLTPEDFGLVALSYVVILALTVYRDAGVGSAMIVRHPLDDRDKGTTLTIILAVSFLSAVVVAALSPLLAAVFDEPRMDGVVAVLALTLVFGAPAWFYEAIMQRELDFRRRFLALSAQTAVYAPTAIVLAALGAGVWSLVAGYVAGAAASAVAYVALAPYRVRPSFDAERARMAVRAGSGFMVQGGVAWVRQNVDYLSVGGIAGAAQLGYYTLAYRLAEVPYLAVADPVAKVTFPAFARMRARGEDASASFLSVLRLIAIVTCPLGVILSGAADPLVEAVLGEKWLAVIGPLTVLGLWASVRSVTATTGWYLNSLGHAGALARVSLVILALLVPGVIVAAAVGDITTVAWVVLADMALELVLIGRLVARHVGVPLSAQWGALRPAVLASPAAWLACFGLAQLTEDAVPGVSLAITLAGGAIAYLGVVSLVDPGAIRATVAQLARTLRRTPPTTAGATG